MAERNMKMKKRVIKEGILHKKTSLLKQWRPRFVVLNRQMLCTFKKEDDQKRGRTAEARIFLMDIESIEKCESKKRKHCFNLIVEGKPFFSFSCSSELDREMWMRSVQIAKENELNEEENDPIRRKSTKLTGGLKRITIQREKGQGLGCTIKNVGGIILVNRILEDGPVSTSGILRPGDQILDINGIEVGGRTVSEISEIIKGSPELVVCTVKPFSDYRYCDTHSTGHTEYAEIDLDSLKAKGNDDSSNSSQDGGSDSPRESNDQKIHSDEVKKRHSLPTVLPDIHSAKDFHKGDTVNYLELNFPQNDRPRGRSDASRSPQVPHRAGRERNKPAAYIELEFNKKENKFQEVGKESSDAKAGDRKSSSLPRS